MSAVHWQGTLDVEVL